MKIQERKPAAGFANHEEEQVTETGKSLAPPPFQLMAGEAPAPPAAPQSSPDGLPADLLNGFAASTGHDLSNVKVHRNSSKPAGMGALAYAQGNDIHLGAGQEQHLAHEAAHIVQQREGRVQATTQVGGNPVNDSASLEREADSMGAKASAERSRGALQMKLARANPSSNAEHKENGAVLGMQVAQRKLKLDGKSKNTSKVVDLINKNIVGETASIGKDGFVTLASKTTKAKPSKEQEAFLKALKVVVDDPSEVLIKVESGNEKYLNGDFASSILDIKDISMCSATEGGTAQAALIHEIYEQYMKQAKGNKYSVAHLAAGKIENQVNGAVRFEGPEKDVVKDELTGEVIKGKFLDGYRYPDGREVITTYTYKDRKLVSVTSKESKPKTETKDSKKAPSKPTEKSNAPAPKSPSK